MSDALKPPLSLLVKVGSIVGHTAEMLSLDGHAFDRHALETVLNDPEVKEWMTAMRAMALVPLPRKP